MASFVCYEFRVRNFPLYSLHRFHYSRICSTYSWSHHRRCNAVAGLSKIDGVGNSAIAGKRAPANGRVRKRCVASYRLTNACRLRLHPTPQRSRGLRPGGVRREEHQRQGDDQLCDCHNAPRSVVPLRPWCICVITHARLSFLGIMVRWSRGCR